MSMRTTPFMVEFLGTPESGKTTVIGQICTNFHYCDKVVTVRESAEITPPFLHKGSVQAHFWMSLTSAKSIFEKKFSSNPDSLILIDRGIVDTIFWNNYHGKNGKLSPNEVSHTNAFFEDLKLMPNLIIFLTTTPENAIYRRGGEGRIVTLDFVSNFNNALNTFMKNVTIPVFHLDTSHLSKDEVYSKVIKEITDRYTSS